MAIATLEAPPVGAGTIRYTGTPNTAGGMTLRALLGGTIASDVRGFDLYIVSAADIVYFENDGTDAGTDTTPLDGPGRALCVRNASQAIHNDLFKLFCAAAVDFRFTLWK